MAKALMTLNLNYYFYKRLTFYNSYPLCTLCEILCALVVKYINMKKLISLIIGVSTIWFTLHSQENPWNGPSQISHMEN